MSRFYIFLTIIICFLKFQQLFAQPDILWTKTHGGPLDYRAYDIEQVSTNGYMIVGSVTTPDGDDDVYIMRTDSNGDTIWTKTYGNHLNEQAFCINPTSDNGFILAGTREYNDIYILRIDADGDTLWTNIYGDDSDESCSFAMQTLDEDFLLVGDRREISAIDENLYLIKINSDGDVIWTKQHGGTDSDNGSTAIELTNGELVILGYTQSFGEGGNDVYLIKTNTTGDTIWTKTYGGSNDDIGITIINTGNGFAIGGYSNSFSAGDFDFYLLLTNYDGDTLLTRKYGGFDDDIGYGIAQSTDNGFLLCGFTTSFGAGREDIYVVKYMNNGEFDWDESYGFDQEETAYSILVTTDGGFIIPGNTESFFSGRDAIYLIKTEPEVSGFLSSNDNSILKYIKLHQNYPNPFNPSTSISFTLPKQEHATLAVYNPLGQKIETLINEPMVAGNHQVEFNAKNMPSGIYYYRIVAGEYQQVKKMVLIK